MKQFASTCIFLCTVLAITFTPVVLAQEDDIPVHRTPAVAGSFYPGTKQALTASLGELFDKASPLGSKEQVQFLVLPHAGYSYSGRVAASGYGSIPEDQQYSNIFIIASSHREQFAGSSVYATGNYITPLGEARVNRQLANELIENNKNIHFYPRAHDREHSIEVQVPFIQYYFEDPPPIVPIVMGSSSVSAARDLATALLPYFNSENLFIISSDFSHYPAYRDAVRIDRLTGEAILAKDPEHFYNTLRKNSSEPVQNLATPCCGWSSVLTVLYMAEKRADLKISPVLYQNSGDTSVGDRDRVVGYWAMAGYTMEATSAEFTINETDRQALLDISRSTLEGYMKFNKVPDINEKELPETLKKEAGAFVSLYMGGRLRGCVGNFFGTEPLYRVVQEMTLAAAVRDRRFAPVEAPELDYIDIEISVLTPLTRISSIDQFQIGRHGIYMSKEGKSGTYLPQVAEQTGWTAEEFLGHCAREKAGIGWEGWKEADLFVYEAIVFGEEKRK